MFGVALDLLFCWMWWIVGQILWMGAAMVGASDFRCFFHPGCGRLGGVLLACFWAAFLSLKRALRAPPRTPSPTPAASAGTPEAQQALATPDEKLARLVKTPKDEARPNKDAR